MIELKSYIQLICEKVTYEYFDDNETDCNWFSPQFTELS